MLARSAVKERGRLRTELVAFRLVCCRINFLKYQPPPRNLDYLQRSEVYRLVHDMEPPVKGVARRPSKVLSEQDYYEKAGVVRLGRSLLIVDFCADEGRRRKAAVKQKRLNVNNVIAKIYD